MCLCFEDKIGFLITIKRSGKPFKLTNLFHSTFTVKSITSSEGQRGGARLWGTNHGEGSTSHAPPQRSWLPTYSSMPQHTLARVTASPGRRPLRVSPHAPLGSPCPGLALALARDCYAALPAPGTSKGTKTESYLHTPTKVGGNKTLTDCFPKWMPRECLEVLQDPKWNWTSSSNRKSPLLQNIFSSSHLWRITFIFTCLYVYIQMHIIKSVVLGGGGELEFFTSFSPRQGCKWSSLLGIRTRDRRIRILLAP